MSCFKSTCPCESRGCRHRPKTVRLRVRHASPHLMMMMMLVMVMVMVMLMRVEIFLIYSFLLFATFRHHNTNHQKKETLHTQRCAIQLLPHIPPPPPPSPQTPPPDNLCAHLSWQQQHSSPSTIWMSGTLSFELSFIMFSHLKC